MSGKYPKIPTVWTRDPETKYRTLVEGQWATPELNELRSIDWVWTEKVDGTNIRIVYDVASVEFRGRTDNAQLPPHLLKALQDIFSPFHMAGTLKGPCTLYGEGYGAKIHGGGAYRSDAGFILFDVWAGMWLEQSTVSKIAEGIGIRRVPEIGRGPLGQAILAVQGGFKSRLRSTAPEGLVMRPQVELLDRRGNRIIAKIKRSDFRAAATGDS